METYKIVRTTLSINTKTELEKLLNDNWKIEHVNSVGGSIEYILRKETK